MVEMHSTADVSWQVDFDKWEDAEGAPIRILSCRKCETGTEYSNPLLAASHIFFGPHYWNRRDRENVHAFDMSVLQEYVYPAKPGSHSPRLHLWIKQMAETRTLEDNIGRRFELEVGALLKDQQSKMNKDSPRLTPRDILQLSIWFIRNCDFTSAWQDFVRQSTDGVNSEHPRLKLHQPAEVMSLQDQHDDKSWIVKTEKTGDTASDMGKLLQTFKNAPQHYIKPEPELDTDICDEKVPRYLSYNDEFVSHACSPLQSEDTGTESSGEESFIQDDESWPIWDKHGQSKIESLATLIGQELAHEFLSKRHGVKACPQQSSQSSSGRPSTGEPSQIAAGSSTALTSVTSVSSRKRRPSSEDDPDDAPTGKRPRQDRSGSNGTLPDVLLACPYSKHDPTRYSEANGNLNEKAYRRCKSVVLSSIPRLKQHLYRVHRRPEYYCSLCYVDFPSEIEREAHTRLQLCILRACPFEEKMTSDQLKAVKRRKMREDPATGWFAIFEVLFPGAARPENPYVEGVHTQAAVQTVNDYSTFLESQLPMRLSMALGEPVFTLDPQTYQWIINSTLEETLPGILRELQDEYETLHPRPDEENEAG